jgi:hypothetical protein
MVWWRQPLPLWLPLAEFPVFFLKILTPFLFFINTLMIGSLLQLVRA